MTRAKVIFQKIKGLFEELKDSGDFFDVDNFIWEIQTRLDIQYDDELLSDFLEVLVMMVRDDEMYDYFGYAGLGILFLELNDWATKVLQPDPMGDPMQEA